jgi:hypothetical protein
MTVCDPSGVASDGEQRSAFGRRVPHPASPEAWLLGKWRYPSERAPVRSKIRNETDSRFTMGSKLIA